ncbi:enoyl-CoA hydratase/isomerase family protein [Pseudomonas sp. nanlin1]|uniref:enoyl-CoA hydratase/isomerase family protein n=1 Tax=Pseudomonas sp. nanlin1 TaxID=3040605 RepID=UPI0038911699
MIAEAFPACQPAPIKLDAQVYGEVRNRVGHLTLNRPEALNALSLDMVRAMRGYLDAWALDPHINAVVLRGAGDKAFCAGGDVRSLHQSYTSGGTLHETFFVEEYALDLCLHHYRKPVLALMDGLTLGGGMGLAQAAELRIVTERSRLAMPETAIGYFPDVGASYFLSRVPGELGTYLGLTGAQIEAADALYCRLADWYVDSERLALLDERLDRVVWTDFPLKDLQGLLAKIGVQALPRPPIDRLRSAIDHFFGLPDIASMIEQLQEVAVADSQEWARKTAMIMRARSPLAMAVSLELLRRGRHCSLEDCFAMELHLDHQWFAEGELIEGVRAMLVDKDKAPRWNPASIDDLPAGRVAQFFRGL